MPSTTRFKKKKIIALTLSCCVRLFDRNLAVEYLLLILQSFYRLAAFHLELLRAILL